MRTIVRLVGPCSCPDPWGSHRAFIWERGSRTEHIVYEVVGEAP